MSELDLSTSDAVTLVLSAIDFARHASECSEVALARREVLEHITLGNPRNSPVTPPLAVQRGVKRYATPEDKPRAKRVAAQKVAANIDTELNSVAKPVPAICASVTVRRCQVCQLDASQWTSNDPCLLNAHDRVVKVPGDFCSKACYEHV